MKAGRMFSPIFKPIILANLMKHFSFLLLLNMLLLMHHLTFAQDCGCDHVITPDNTYIDGNNMNIKPGDVICIKAGKYKMLNLFNFSGTAAKPITFINCGGQVNIGGYQHYYGLIINNVNYFRFTGTGTPGIKYGFKIDGINDSGSGVAGYGVYGEIDHLEIGHTGFAGILYKHDPSCDPTSWRRNYVMRQISIHDNYVHDTKGEGLYIGYTGGAKTLTCSGKSETVYPHNIEGLKVFNNQIENTGWDGLQVSRAVKDCEIYNNTIKNFGKSREKYQDEGILLGSGTTGKVYNNTIIKGTGVGIQVFGSGDNYIYNNVVVEPEDDGIFCDDRETVAGRGFYFMNNTIINPGQAGMRMYSTQSKGNVFYNNVIVGASQNIILLNGNVDWKATNNLFQGNVSGIKFTNPSQYDYHLNSGSPAIDAGKDVASYGVKTDYENKKRPQGKGYDIGAFEYGSGGSTPVNQAPTVNAGQDVNLTLPNNSTTLTAKASDTDGSIAQYAWTQASGPSTASLANQNTASVKVSNLKEGTYSFKIVVTDDDKATASDQINVVVKANSSGGSGNNGLQYAYYEGNWSSLPDFSKLSAKKTGKSANFSLGARLKDDYFGFTFQGAIDIQTAGQYTFYTSSDDGSALYIDGKKVVDNNGLHSLQEKSGSVTLSKGRHSIQALFFEKTGGEVLEVRYSGPGISKKLIPDNVLFPDNDSTEPPANDHGVHYAYYEGTWNHLPEFSNLSAKKTGTVTNFSLNPRTVNDNFGFAFTSYIDIQTAGQYTFYTTSDDGSELYIDGKRVVNNDGVHGKKELSGNVSLSKGLHAIKVIFFENKGGQVLEARYSGPGIGKKLIPDNVLYLNNNGNSTPSAPSGGNGNEYTQGLQYKYYEGDIRQASDFAKQKVLKQGIVTNFTLAPHERPYYFGFEYEGYIEIKASGNYTFYVNSDDGSKLWINGKEVVNNDGIHDALERSGSISLNKGTYPIKVAFFEHANKEILQVNYSGPGFGKKPVPDEVLFYDKNDNARLTQSVKKGKETTEAALSDMQPFAVTAFPNPVEDVINLEIAGVQALPQHVKVLLIDLSGQVTDLSNELQYEGNVISINTNALAMPSGIYFLNITTDTGEMAKMKIIKK